MLRNGLAIVEVERCGERRGSRLRDHRGGLLLTFDHVTEGQRRDLVPHRKRRGAEDREHGDRELGADGSQAELMTYRSEPARPIAVLTRGHIASRRSRTSG